MKVFLENFLKKNISTKTSKLFYKIYNIIQKIK